jgi:hypothetical protein
VDLLLLLVDLLLLLLDHMQRLHLLQRHHLQLLLQLLQLLLLPSLLVLLVFLVLLVLLVPRLPASACCHSGLAGLLSWRVLVGVGGDHDHVAPLERLLVLVALLQFGVGVLVGELLAQPAAPGLPLLFALGLSAYHSDFCCLFIIIFLI